MPLSQNAKDAIQSADDWMRQVNSIQRHEDKALLLQRTQIMLLKALLIEVSESRGEAPNA